MVTEGQVHVVNEGESIVLECSFHADGYSLFDYPVLWRKIQRDEETQMNIMGNINEPFASTNRFEVAFQAQPPRYKFELSVLDVTRVDSGNYTCEIRGPYSSILGQSTHYVYVRVPIQSIAILDSASPSATPSTVSGSITGGDERVLRATENHLTQVRCVTIGGYPPPNVEMLVGRRHVTNDFAQRRSSSLSGRRGLRLVTYRVERWSQSFRVDTFDQNARLTCVATVQGLKPVTDSVRLDVDYEPKVTCSHLEARLGDHDVCIRCKIDAKPHSSSLTWEVDHNGTMLTDGQVFDDLWTFSMQQPDGLTDTHLCMKTVERESFRKYTLFVDNKVATIAHAVLFSEKPKEAENTPQADYAVSLHSPPSVATIANRTVSSTVSRDTSRKLSNPHDKLIGRSVPNFRSDAMTSLRSETKRWSRLICAAFFVHLISHQLLS